MKFLVLALFVAAAVAAPVPDEDNNDAVELIVNGVPEGTPLELGGIVEMHLKEHVNGELASSTNLLHPLTAAGLAETAAAAEQDAPTPIQIVDEAEPESDYQTLPDAIVLPDNTPVIVSPIVPIAPVEIPDSIVQPEIVAPVDIPESIVMPEPAAPVDIPESIVLPQPVVPVEIPESIVMPDPVVPESVAPESVAPVEVPETVLPEPIPDPAPQIPGEIFNNGLVQVQVNTPQDAGLMSTLQNWFSLVVNYISNGIQTSQQIV